MKTFFILPSFLSKKSYEILCEFVCQIKITRIFDLIKDGKKIKFNFFVYF